MITVSQYYDEKLKKLTPPEPYASEDDRNITLPEHSNKAKLQHSVANPDKFDLGS